MGRRDQQAGRIPLPPVEILELDRSSPAAKPARLSPEDGWLGRLLGRKAASRFILDPSQIPADLLGGRRDFALLAFDDEGRPVLRVLPGMQGELRIGVSEMSVAQMLADPALHDPAQGGARLPLSNGARLRICCGPKTFVARVGGPPLPQTPQPGASQAANAGPAPLAASQLAHA